MNLLFGCTYWSAASRYKQITAEGLNSLLQLTTFAVDPKSEVSKMDSQ